MSDDILKAISGLGSTVSEFQAKNDARLDEIEKRGSEDVVASEQVDRINATITELRSTIDDLQKKAARKVDGGKDVEAIEAIEHRSAWNKWARKGVEGDLQAKEAAAIEAKALSVGSDADGGFAVPQTVDSEVYSLLQEYSDLRSIFSVIQVGSSDYKKLVNLHGAASGWVGETAPRPGTDTPQLAEIGVVEGELYANPQATQKMLDDAFFNVEGWIAGEVTEEFAIQEAEALINGNGTNKPQGLLSYPTAATSDKTRAFGTFQALNTGVNGDFAAANKGDILISAIHALGRKYRNGASWMMNTNVIEAVRKFKDSEGNYLWRPGLEAGQSDMLLGYKIEDIEEMPDLAAGSKSIGFGNWKRAYVIADRMGMRTLRDPYTNKPYVGFYTTKRVGGMAQDTKAAKFVNFAT